MSSLFDILDMSFKTDIAKLRNFIIYSKKKG